MQLKADFQVVLPAVSLSCPPAQHLKYTEAVYWFIIVPGAQSLSVEAGCKDDVPPQQGSCRLHLGTQHGLAYQAGRPSQ